MTEEPLVSIIINNYNYDRFLGEAIQSALDQSYVRTEIVVVDDGSTDHSRAVIRRFEKANPGRIRSVLKSNGGQASAFNAGFAASTGEIITFLDSDDYWFRDRVRTIVAAHRAAAVVQHTLLCQHRLFRVLRHHGDMRRFLRELGLMRNCVPTSALSYRREAVRGAFPLPEDPLRLCADSYLRNYAVYHHGIASVPDCLGVYRRHGENRWHDQMRFQRPNIVADIRLLLNRRLETEGCAPIPANPAATEQAFLLSFVVEAGRHYLVYGAGSLGLKVKAEIERRGGLVTAFADRDPGKQSTGAAGLPVHAPTELPALRATVHRIVIGTTFVESALETLEELGLVADRDVLVPLDIEGRNESVQRRRLVLFGASTLGQRAAEELGASHGILGFVDNDARKWGSVWAGRPVWGPERLKTLDGARIVITSVYHAEIAAQLRALGISDFELYRPATASTGAPPPAKDFIAEINTVRTDYGETLALIHAQGHRPGTVVDVGVAFGTPELYKAFPDSDLILIEPLEEFRPYLEKIAAQRERVRFVVAAAGSKDGETEISVTPDKTTSSVLSLGDTTRRSVPVVRVDGLCRRWQARPPYVIKADVQGFELTVMAGCTGILAETLAVVLEVSFWENPDRGVPAFLSVLEHMKQLGFVVYDVVGGHNRPLDRARAQADVVFVQEHGVLRADRRWATPEQIQRFLAAKRAKPIFRTVMEPESLSAAQPSSPAAT